MNYTEIIKRLDNEIPFKRKDSLDSKIEKVANVINKMQVDLDPSKTIVVAGTNGKGTTSMTLAHLLTAYEKSVGLFTSPHLIRINERIKIGHQMLFDDISDEDFTEAFNYVYDISNDLSYFEYLTCMACYHFFIKHNVDYAVFEVGLGGTYDSTNAIPHDTCVLTKLGIDHEEHLGSTIGSVAVNKFGIINNSGSRRQTVVHLPFQTEEIRLLSQKYDGDFIESCEFGMDVERGTTTKFFINTKYGRSELAIQGKRACENTALALTALNALGFDPREKFAALRSVNWPGRMEHALIDGYNVMLSGDHNPQGIDSLLEIISYYDYDDIYFIVGIACDKDFNSILQKLHEIQNSHLLLTETPVKTRMLADYGSWINKCGHAHQDWRVLLNKIPRSERTVIIITGSLYLVGAVKQAVS